MEWDGICFDVDNTMYSHEEAFKRAIRICYYSYLHKLGLSKDSYTFETFFSIFKENCDTFWDLYEKKQVTGIEYRRIRFNETMKKIGLPLGESYADVFNSHYYSIVADFCEPFLGLHELLAYLIKQQKKVAIITNGKMQTQSAKIEKLGVKRWIPSERIIISEEVGYEKPNREIFKITEKKLDLSPQQLIYIGDSWMHDVVGALEARWSSIFINTRGDKRMTNHNPVMEFHKLEQVRQFFLRI